MRLSPLLKSLPSTERIHGSDAEIDHGNSNSLSIKEDTLEDLNRNFIGLKPRLRRIWSFVGTRGIPGGESSTMERMTAGSLPNAGKTKLINSQMRRI